MKNHVILILPIHCVSCAQVSTQCANCRLGYWASGSFPPHPIISGSVSWGNYCEFWIQPISLLSLGLLMLPHAPSSRHIPLFGMPLRTFITQAIYSFDRFLSTFLLRTLLEHINISWVHTYCVPMTGTGNPYLDTEMVRHVSCPSLRQLEGVRWEHNRYSK